MWGMSTGKVSSRLKIQNITKTQRPQPPNSGYFPYESYTKHSSLYSTLEGFSRHRVKLGPGFKSEEFDWLWYVAAIWLQKPRNTSSFGNRFKKDREKKSTLAVSWTREQIVSLGPFEQLAVIAACKAEVDSTCARSKLWLLETQACFLRRTESVCLMFGCAFMAVGLAARMNYLTDLSLRISACVNPGPRFPVKVMYSVATQTLRDSSHCSSTNVVPFIWWHKKVIDLSAEFTLASLVNGNEMFSKVTGWVPLINMASDYPTVATSDWLIKLQYSWWLLSPGPKSVLSLGDDERSGESALRVKLRLTIGDTRCTEHTSAKVSWTIKVKVETINHKRGITQRIE